MAGQHPGEAVVQQRFQRAVCALAGFLDRFRGVDWIISRARPKPEFSLSFAASRVRQSILEVLMQTKVIQQRPGAAARHGTFGVLRNEKCTGDPAPVSATICCSPRWPKKIWRLSAKRIPPESSASAPFRWHYELRLAGGGAYDPLANFRYIYYFRRYSARTADSLRIDESGSSPGRCAFCGGSLTGNMRETTNKRDQGETPEIRHD
jgi:hypothetical protein